MKLIFIQENAFENVIFNNSLWPSDTMVTEIWVNIGSGNGLLPDSTKPLPQPMLTDHQWGPMTFILGEFHNTCLNHQSLKSIWKLHGGGQEGRDPLPPGFNPYQGFLFASAIGHSPTKYLYVRTQWCKQDKMSWIKIWYFPIVSKLIQKLLYNTIVLALL